MQTWQQILRTNFTQWEPLADFLELSPSQRTQIISHTPFPLNLPHRLATKIAKQTLEDPILRQFLPVEAELRTDPGFTRDPVDEMTFRASPRLLQKYHGRALLTVSSACAMHCRYCFRRHFDYASGGTPFNQELELISKDPSLSEVLLSGGDPLSLPNHRLTHLIEQIGTIPHVKRIRMHTRFPIGIPERIDEGLLEGLANASQQFWFVIHCNHPRELDDDVLHHLKQVQQLGIPILNQSVLLRGVNDSVAVLKRLSETLIDWGIVPYYLHQLDRVEGAAHFEVPIAQGQQLVQALRNQLPGYAIPEYVQEVAGESSKQPLTSPLHPLHCPNPQETQSAL